LKNRSYKSDDKAKQTPERLIARKDLVTQLELGQTRLSLRLKLTHAQRDALIDDASGDSLDAVLCMLQAAWALLQHEKGDKNYGLPAKTDALEGWIITA
jgi:predicted RNase H-like nuclease